MFHDSFAARPHLALLPDPSRAEVDRATEEYDILRLYSQVAQALDKAIEAHPAEEVPTLGDDFAELILAVLQNQPEAQQRDRFDLYPTLYGLPRIVLQMIYNHFLVDDLQERCTSIEVPPAL